MIHGLNSWERRITCIVHPDAEGVVMSEKFGGIRTEVGPIGYVLSDGTRVALHLDGRHMWEGETPGVFSPPDGVVHLAG